MDLDNTIECISISSSDEMEEEADEVSPRDNRPIQFSVMANNGVKPAASVHELLECPVGTNLMYPPIHKVMENNDISAYILSRLPSQTLLGLKRVNKEWQRLISQPIFIKEQLKTNEPLSGFFFQETYQWCNEDIKAISYIQISDDNNKRVGASIECPVFEFLPEDVVILAVTNGLVCCRSSFPCSKPFVYVCNPSNKEWVPVTLPCHRADKWSLGLAFNPFKDVSKTATNFKVVRIHETVTTMDDSYFLTFSFEIYSSKTREWKNSKETCFSYYHVMKNKGSCVKGRFLFWITNGDQIIMFDAEDDVARVVKAPVPVSAFNSLVCIGESDEKLDYIIISKEGVLVWALDDYIEFNWELKFFVDLDEMEHENSEFLYNLKMAMASRMSLGMGPGMDPLAYKDGIMLMRESNKIYLYNFDTRKMEEVCIVSDLGRNAMFSPIVLPFSVSLVPLAF